MFLGIDVGGTFTDAVIIENDCILKQAKEKTTHENIFIGLLASLEDVIKNINTGNISRVTLSTTLITNAIVSNNVEKTAIIAVPGPGYNCEKAFPVKPIILDGYTDHRGEHVWPLSFGEKDMKKLSNYVNIAVSSKFSVRNPHSELLVKDCLEKKGIKNIVLGHDMSGDLGFIRRTNSAYFTASTLNLFDSFIIAVKNALNEYGIECPLYILKADGGTMPVSWAKKHTCEAFFTGPAASVMGIKYLINPSKNAISLDIGGTTTDIAFWEKSHAVMKKRGANVLKYPTAIRSMHLSSIALGGDSEVKILDGKIFIGPQRVGPAMALGGIKPTLTDAFLVLGFESFGDKSKSEEAMKLLDDINSPEITAKKIMNEAISLISCKINEMVEEYAMEPVYKVEDIVNEKRFLPEVIIGVGGAASGIIPLLGEQMNIPFEIPQNAMVANAVGAALSKPTLVAHLRADTGQGTCIIPEGNLQTKVSKDFSSIDAKNYLTKYLKDKAEEIGIDFTGTDVLWLEEVPVVRGMWRTGKIINLAMQLNPGVLTFSKEGSENA